VDLPLPIAVLLRRARNAKSPKERHDTAYFAWEASVRLAVAARPPREPGGLARASLGRWVAALAPPEEPLAGPAPLAAFVLFAEAGEGRRAAPRVVAPRRLLDSLPAYRNEVIGHGAVRTSEFYDRSAEVLLAGLEATWEAGVFWPAGARLVHVAAPGARLRELAGPAGRDGDGDAPADAAPGRLYARTGGGLVPLHPWLLYEEAELGERVLFFNGVGRSPRYLDYVSGEQRKGEALLARFPSIRADLLALMGEVKPDPAEAEKAADPALFGDYRLLGPLGEGGMGIVHLARQEDLAGRLVALKRLPPGADAMAAARLRREIAALSRCDHPNVVKILASGEAQGAPYYAMELVEGADLGAVGRELAAAGDADAAVAIAAEKARAAHADALGAAPARPRAAAVRDRFATLAVLCRDAARGLHHLHEQGIVHRDVKPANLMVTAADHRIVVMDLGLAAVADASRSLTREKSLLGTIRYMAPEQLERGAREADRRADVYALGATFYELLAGGPIFDGESEARLLAQVLHERPRPLAKASPRIPRDLAVIVEKATEKEPRRRYETAEALAQDLDAFLAGRPIAARPATLGYVLSLAVRRNKVAAAAIAGALLAILVGAAVFVAGIERAREREELARRAAEESRARAEENRARAEDLLGFMLFDLKDRLDPLGRLDILEGVVAKAKAYYDSLPVEGRTAAEEGKHAAALVSIGQVLEFRSRPEEALASYRASLAIRERLAAADPTNLEKLYDVARARFEVGSCIGVVSRGGMPMETLAFLVSALGEFEALLARAPEKAEWLEDLANTHARIGIALREQGEPEAALASTERALGIRRRIAARDSQNSLWQRQLAAGCGELGTILADVGRDERALASLREALGIIERLTARDPEDMGLKSDIMMIHGRIADVLMKQIRCEEALVEYRAAIGIAELIVARDPTESVLHMSLCGLLERAAEAQRSLERADEARASYRASLAISEAAAARDPASVAWQRHIARTRRLRGEIAGTTREALEDYRAAIEVERRLATAAPGPDGIIELDVSLSGAAGVLRTEGRREEALALEREALERVSAAGLDGRVALAHLAIGELQDEGGGVAEALASYRASIEAAVRNAAAHADEPEAAETLASCRAALGVRLGESGDLAAAASETALALAASGECPAALAARALVRGREGAYDEAVALASRAIELSPDWALARLARGRALAARGEVEAALADLTLFEQFAPHDPRAAGARALARELRERAGGALR
jgi:serine/threonine protein kinase